MDDATAVDEHCELVLMITEATLPSLCPPEYIPELTAAGCEQEDVAFNVIAVKEPSEMPPVYMVDVAVPVHVVDVFTRIPE
jgi:hypothetical protein